jgi:uncharacterized membrane protein YeaQ/YmgE (transglycosylase-associated protein family)
MFLSLDTSTQLFLFTSVVLCSFFIASAMDGVLSADGFGVIGNQVIIVAGFYLGIWTARHFGYSVSNFTYSVVIGLAGAFIALLVLAIIKALLSRL